MEYRELLRELERRAIAVRVADTPDNLHFDAPVGTLVPDEEFIEELRRHKAELLDLIRPDPRAERWLTKAKD